MSIFLCYTLKPSFISDSDTTNETQKLEHCGSAVVVTLTDYEDEYCEHIDLHDFKGKVVKMNFNS